MSTGTVGPRVGVAQQTTQVRRALVSVWDKEGVTDLVRVLTDADVAVISTGSTARVLRDAGLEVTEVADVTGFPELLDGRVKTLHPAVHAGLLADRGRAEHMAALTEHGIGAIDLVVCNLYPFQRTVAQRVGDGPVDAAEAIEMIDVGGPTMVRAAAKNHAWVTVVTDPSQYDGLLAELGEHGGVTASTRERLAAEAFAHTARYDGAVAAYLGGSEALPPLHVRTLRRRQHLRYGENPHQLAAWYVEDEPWGLSSLRQLHGKELSYNNLLDADAAWGMCSDFDEPCVVIVKHCNPAGLALGESLADAYPRALAGDPTSAFGGIVAVNRPLDVATAERITDVFTEVVVAPAVDDAALAVLSRKANLRVVVLDQPLPPLRPIAVRSVGGGLLVADADAAPETPDSWTVPTASKPDEATLAELSFAWTACKHTRSNAIVLTRDRAVVGVGAGQMSRVDSVRLAVGRSDGRAEGAVLASDAFFPFRDGPDAAMEAGVRAIVQPGGSVRDEEVVAACDERGVPLVLTGRRHFRH